MTAAITSNSTASRAAAGKSASRFGELTSDQFTRIMLSELQSQDPLKPNDSNTLLQQLSSIRSIESNLGLEKKLSAILQQNELASAGNLLGAQVGGLNGQNDRVTGVVVGITTSSDGINLTLDRGWQLPFKNVDSIVLPNTSPPTTTPPTTTPPTTTPPTTTPGGVTPTLPFVPVGVLPHTGGSVTPATTAPTTGATTGTVKPATGSGGADRANSGPASE